jgi:hypothetical protein
MKSETLQTYKSPRWIVFYVSLAMMAVGWFAGHGFDYLSRRFPPASPRNSFDGRFDPETLLCCYLLLAGMFLCAVWCLWMLAAVIISLFRPKHPKQV